MDIQNNFSEKPNILIPMIENFSTNFTYIRLEVSVLRKNKGDDKVK
jgi:hypothetical protein